MPDWRSVQTWELGLLQASSGLLYFGANTFLPDYLGSIALPGLLAIALATLNAAQVPASLVVGLLPWRVLSHPLSIVLNIVFTLVGIVALLSQRGVLIVIGAAIIGFTAANILVVCFALPALLAGPRDIARLSAGTFTISYCLVFTANLAAGALWDVTRQSAFAFLPVLVGGAFMAILGPRLLRAASLAQHVAGIGS